MINRFRNFFKGKKKLIILISAGLAVALIVIFFMVILPTIKNKKLFNIASVEIAVNGIITDNIETPLDGANLALSVVVNGGKVNYKKYRQPEIIWRFNGNSLGCTINDGVLKMDCCDTLGTTAVGVTVKSGNEKTAEISFKVIPKENSVLQSIELDGFDAASSFIEGQPIDKADLVVIADFGEYDVKVIDYTTDKQKFSLADRELQINYTSGDIEKNIIVPVSVEPKSLQAIRITRVPDNTSYTEGQKFDNTGMEITADYEYLSEIVFDYYFDEDKILFTNDDVMEIYYTENHALKGSITKSVEQSIIVNKRILQTLSVNTENAKLNYVQGQRFDCSGLIVTAVYDVGEQIITDYEIDTETKLVHGTTEMVLTYAENDITKNCTIQITVDKPYTNFRQVIFDNNSEETVLTWFYYYMTDDGEDKIDNTAASENDLAYNEPIGTYLIPVGAEITIEAVNPAIIDFYLDGVVQGLQYPSRTINFTLSSGNNPLSISLKKINNRVTLSFVSDAARTVFSYRNPWNGHLIESDLKQVSTVFNENDIYNYNVYLIDGKEYLFSELATYNFSSDCMVRVEKRERKSGIQITLVYWDDVEVLISIDETDADWKSKLPQLERVGYKFLGWLEKDEKFVAQWEMHDVEYSGAFIADWYYKYVLDVTIECFITLNSNGTYVYETYVDDAQNLKLYGFYEYDDIKNEITVLNVESDTDLILVSPSDFEIDLENLLSAKLFVVDGYDLYEFDAHFDIVTTNP